MKLQEAHQTLKSHVQDLVDKSENLATFYSLNLKSLAEIAKKLGVDQKKLSQFMVSIWAGSTKVKRVMELFEKEVDQFMVDNFTETEEPVKVKPEANK